MWMKWSLVISLVIGLSGAANQNCPSLCHCNETSRNILEVKCSNIQALFKYSLRNKDFDPHSVDLSDSNISKIDYNFDKFSNLIHLDLSSNHIEHVNKFLRNCTSLKSLKLSSNNLKTLASLPLSLETLDVSNNLFEEIPSVLEKLHNLKHLELSGNPIECDCEGLKLLTSLVNKGVTVSDFKCSSQGSKKSKLWAEYKISEECQKLKLNSLDMMMGDEPSDVEIVGDDSLGEKSLPMTSLNELNKGQVWEGGDAGNNDDEKEFLKVNTEKPETEEAEIEGSGDLSEVEHTTLQPKLAKMVNLNPVTEVPEGSGDDSGNFFGTTEDPLDYYDGSGDDINENTTSTTETAKFITGLADLNPFFVHGYPEHNATTEEPFEEPPRPTLFLGNIDWDAEPSESPNLSSSTSQVPIIEEPILINKVNTVEQTPNETKNSDLKEEDCNKPKKASTGTIVCIAIIIILLLGLILITIIKGYLRNRREQRLLRQEKKDAEIGDKEMVEMNKALLGKPAPVIQKNGTYELVPLHDNSNKKPNGNLGSKSTLNNSPPPKRNGSLNQLDSPKTPKIEEPQQNGSPEVPKTSPKVLRTAPEVPKTSLEKTLTNGDSSHLTPPSEYVPVYGSEAGRVKIKMTETPKAKTPVLVTRSRSNAGDIIITPAESPKHKSVT